MIIDNHVGCVTWVVIVYLTTIDLTLLYVVRFTMSAHTRVKSPLVSTLRDASLQWTAVVVVVVVVVVVAVVVVVVVVQREVCTVEVGVISNLLHRVAYGRTMAVITVITYTHTEREREVERGRERSRLM